MTKYESPTTPGVLHDKANLLVEVAMLNKYGFQIPPYAWRKKNPLYNDWQDLIKLIKVLIKKHGISAEQLAWYLSTFKTTDLNTSTFGLHLWKIKKYFRRMSLDQLAVRYKALIKPVDNPDIYDYSTKIRKNKSLLDILEDITHGKTQEDS